MSDLGIAVIWFLGLFLIYDSLAVAVYGTLFTAIGVVAASYGELALRITIFTAGLMMLHIITWLHFATKRAHKAIRSAPTYSKSCGPETQYMIERTRRRSIISAFWRN